MPSFSLKILLLATALFAICFAALTAGTLLWARLMFTTVLIFNLYAIVGIILTREIEKSFWIGFAVFGWTCWTISNLPSLGFAEYMLFSNEISTRLNGFAPEINQGGAVMVQADRIFYDSFTQNIKLSCALALSLLGGALSAWTYSRKPQAGFNHDTESAG